jgi:glutaredoxin
MEMKHTLTLYTQPDCMYCDMMKTKLEQWGYKYKTKDIKADADSRAFIVLDEGHRTVPQLYYGKTHINPNINTEEYTQSILEQYIGHLDEVK